MKVILLTDIDGLGTRGQTVDVSDGYARNHLLPTKRALRATAGATRVAQDVTRGAERREAKVRGEAEDKARGLDGVRITIVANAGDEGKLFGSVSVTDISDALTSAGVEVKKSEVSMPEGPIRNIGEYEIDIHFHTDITKMVKVNVVAE